MGLLTITLIVCYIFCWKKIILEVVLRICYIEVLFMLVYYRKILNVGVV